MTDFTMNILLVEDNPADARLLEESLRDAQSNGRFEVAHARRLDKALSLLDDVGFDVVLLDLGLPDSQGMETFTRVREKAPEVPLVVLTGLEDEDLAAALVRGGAQDYLVKGHASGTALLRVLRYALERTRITKALRESEERLKTLFEYTPDPVLLVDPDTGSIVDANPAASRLLDRPLEEIRKMHQSELHPACFADEMNKAFCERMSRLKEMGRIEPIEVPVMRSDGSVRTIEVRDEMVELQGKTIVQAIFRDITERKLAEKALRDSQMSLANAQRIARVGNWDWNIVSNELRWSDEIYRIFGTDKEGFASTYEAFLSFIHPDDKDLVESAVNKALYEGKPYSIDHRIVLPDGVGRMVHEQAEVEFDKERKPLRMSGTVQDITERKLAEQEIRKLNRALEEKVERQESAIKELEAFNYTVSHDLGAPLRIIDGFSRILLEDHSLGLDEKGKRFLRVIWENSRKMGMFIRDLLKLARMDRQEINKSYVDMRELAKEASSELIPGSAGNELRLEIGDLPPALGEKTMLQQVFVNLISNAVKFTRQKKDALIEVSGRAQGEENLYFVRDNGVGFDPKYSEKIFDIFQRAHKPEEFDGTGVGLAIVQRIIKRHGGRAWAESKPGEGATFYFTIPA